MILNTNTIVCAYYDTMILINPVQIYPECFRVLVTDSPLQRLRRVLLLLDGSAKKYLIKKVMQMFSIVQIVP